MNTTPQVPHATTYINATRPQTVRTDDIPRLSDDELTRDAIRCLSRHQYWIRTVRGAVSVETQRDMLAVSDRLTAIQREQSRRRAVGTLA